MEIKSSREIKSGSGLGKATGTAELEARTYVCYEKFVLVWKLHKAAQIGCFNHRVVTLVADYLERQWL